MRRQLTIVLGALGLALALVAIALVAVPAEVQADNPTVLACHITGAGTGHTIRVNLTPFFDGKGKGNAQANALDVHLGHGDCLEPFASGGEKPGAACSCPPLTLP